MRYLTALALLMLTPVSYGADKGGFFLEPAILFENGETKTDYPTPLKESDGDVVGFGAGLRLGFHVYESLFIGADGRYSLPNFEDSSLDQDTDSTSYNYGPVVGLQMPTSIGLRFWGSYVMDSRLDPEKDQRVDVKFSDGTGYRLGAGIKLGITSLNLEYQFIKYDKAELEEVGTFSPALDFNDVELKNRSWILSVSFPVSL